MVTVGRREQLFEHHNAALVLVVGFLAVALFCTAVGGPVYVPALRVLRRAALVSHGSAQWESDFNHALLPKGEHGGLLLGRVFKSDAAPRKFDRRYRAQQHVLTAAPTGSGKGVGCVIPHLLEYPGSTFVLDVKGENWAVTSRWRQSSGHNVRTIDPFNLTGHRRDSVNWLDAIDPESEDCVSEAAALADTLVPRAPRGDSHWDDTAANLLQTLTLHACTLPKPQRHMGTVRELLTGREERFTGLLEELSSDEGAAFGLLARGANSYLGKAPRERSGVLSTAQRHTAFLDDPQIIKTVTESTIDFGEMKRSAVDVYLCIPPDKLGPYQRYVRAVLGGALRAMIRERTQPEFPVVFLLDEFGTLGHFGPVEDGVSLLRGYGVRLWLLVQDLSQLQAVYPRWRTFLANMTLQAFGTQDHDTAKYLSEMMGQTTIEVESRGGSHSSAERGGGTHGKSTSVQAHGRALAMPDEIRTLADHVVLVLAQGRRPAMLRRLNYLKDKEMRGRFDPNPMHPEDCGHGGRSAPA